MKVKFCLAFLLVIVISIKTGFCNDAAKIEDLDADVQKHLWMIIKNPFDLKDTCTTINAVDVKFTLFNRQVTGGKEIDPKKPEEIGTDKKIVMLIHGWLANATSSKMVELKNAYLQRYDCSVVMVDWSATAWKNYSRAACDNLATAQQISNFLCVFTGRTQVPLSEIHVIGHSIGAHTAGVVGYNVINRCKQTLGRITGLDPTAPMFFRIPEKERLDKTDALHVDVILTHSGYFGYYEAIGHVHFSPNCALFQPGCPPAIGFTNSTLITDAMCSHLRSVVYMTESVNSKEFVAVSCSLCPRYCKPDIINEVYTIMGEECRTVPKPARNFLIPTNSTPPYALGKGAHEKNLMLDQTEGNDEQSKLIDLLLANLNLVL